MFKMSTSLLLLLLYATVCVTVKINTKLGELEGDERTSRDGKAYYAFTSVPYAKPPVGKLRLKNPVRAEPWEGVLDATEELPQCLHVHIYLHYLRNKTWGQEDCLYLSIYTPELNSKEKLAVLIQMHGGGFRSGNAGPKYNPGYLMDGNVILVNVHYRLGTLGFLSTEDTVIPGNFGLKDQAMAIQWVKQNIEEFGGDSNRITVFGESAGGASAHYHMISPLTKDLIKGAISQSGVINTVWSSSAAGSARPVALRVADIVGCNGKEGEHLLECFQNTSPVSLIRAELKLLYWTFEPHVFRPVPEPAGEGAFIPFDPLKQETTLPWMTGIVSSEGAIEVAALKSQKDSVTQEFIDNIDDYMFNKLYLQKSSSAVKATIELLKSKYFPEPLTVQSVQKGLGDIFSDMNMAFPMANAISKHKGPIYQYLYDYRAGSSYTQLFTDLPDLGVSHGDELLTLFNFTEQFPKTKPDDDKVSRIMVKLWTNFAKYQNPTPEDEEVLIQWPNHDSMGHYLHITTEPSVKRHLKADAIDWWHNLPIYKKFERSEL